MSEQSSSAGRRRWVVAKFGGTSVSSRELWQEIAAVTAAHRADGWHVVIVVSAVRGVTDRLQSFADAPDAGAVDAVLAEIRRLHEPLGGLDEPAVALEFEALRAALQACAEHRTPANRAAVLACGERLSSRIGRGLLADAGTRAHWVDARELLFADDSHNPRESSRYLAARCEHAPDPALEARLAQTGDVHLTQGFVARNGDGETVVLGRGGSDTSAAYLAAVIGADRLEIWTDVPGMFSANPRQISGARLLRLLGYREAQELASMGARVLHPRCIEPAREFDIPLAIRQTGRPDVEGTLISHDARDFAAQVKAIVHRRNLTLVVMDGLRMWQQVGFLADAFAVFKRHGLSIDLVSTSESNVTVSLDLDEHLLSEEVLATVEQELGALCRVEIIHHCASVSLVGMGIRTILHRLGPALEVFEERRIFLVSQAANDLNLTFVVEARHAEQLVQQLHQTLIPGGVGGDSVFGPTWDQLFREEQPSEHYLASWWRGSRDRLLDLMAERDAAYVYDVASVRDAVGRLTALENVDRVLFAVKANANSKVIAAAAAAGAGMETVSVAEIEHVRGIVPDLPAERILFTPNFAPREEYRAALELGVNLTLDNPYVLEHWGPDFAGREVFLRIDPGSGLGHHKLVRTAGTFSKFGIPRAALERVAELAAQHRIVVRGLHAHTGSGVMHADAWERTLRVLGESLDLFPEVAHIDVGGGFGVPDKPDELPLDLGALDAGLARARALLARDVSLWVEPGRYLVSSAGVLLLRVTQLKGKGELKYVGVASGMNSLIRPALYGAYHDIQNLTRLGEPANEIYNVVGPICETGDVLGLDRVLPACREGDILLLANAGAYGAVMGSRYNLRNPAEEVVVDTGR
ncbi:MAG: bifunctional aspartate kinase/diaminopimelate decarboxylase [Pseudomonadota bacterium]